jgi:uncharacterized protein YegL
MSSVFGLTVLSEIESLARGDRRASFVARIDPPAAPVKRTPVRLVMALDTSGSMAGEKIAAAQASAAALVRALGPDDTFACVTFSTRVATLIAPTSMTGAGKSLAIEQLGRARAGGNTDLAGAILSSLRIANEAGGGRVLLLTDGCPTEGVTDEKQIDALTRGSAARSTLSTFGFGRDVNPLLLQTLADTGRGNYTFIEAGEPPTMAIAGELGGILLTVAAGVTLSLRAGPGVRIDKVHRLAGVAWDVPGREAAIELPPLVAEEPVYVAFELSWDGDAAESLALATLSARRTSDGSAVQLEAHAHGRVGDARGAIVAAAAREILLARAAVALGHASTARDRSARDLATSLTAQIGEFSGAARLAGLESDPEIAAALALMAEAQRGLAAQSSEQQDRSRQDLVAAAASVRGKRNTHVGKPDTGSPFVTKSQKTGWDLVTGKKSLAIRGMATRGHLVAHLRTSRLGTDAMLASMLERSASPMLAVTLLVAGCGSEPPAATTTPATERTLVHAYPEITTEPGQEIAGLCRSWTLDNDADLLVDVVHLAQTEGSHHANFVFVPETAFDGPDGAWDCAERGYDFYTAMTLGGLLHVQSASPTPDASRPDGVVVRVPRRSRIVGDVHLLNTTDLPTTGHATLTLTTVPAEDVKVELTPFHLQYGQLRIGAHQDARFTASCSLADAMSGATGQPYAPRLHYALPYTRSRGKRVSLRVLGGPANGATVFSVGTRNGEAPAFAFDPPLDLAGSTGVTYACEYQNDGTAEVAWGLDGEACEIFGYLEQAPRLSTTVTDAVPSGIDGPTLLYEGRCAVTLAP